MSALSGIKNGVLQGVTTYNVTSSFGPRTYMINGKVVSDVHQGIDLTPKANILAFQRGKVIEARDGISLSQYTDIVVNKRTALYAGNYVILQHANGATTKYAHLAQGSIKVKVGDVVEKGDVIGIMGSTGYSTGIHLHFEIRINKVATDPTPYLQAIKTIPPYIEAIITERPLQSVLIASASQQFYRKDPNGDSVAYLIPGVEYPLLGVTNVVNGWRWAQIVVDNAIVYSAINPAWNKIVDPAPVIKEVYPSFDKQIEVGNVLLTVSMKAKG